MDKNHWSASNRDDYIEEYERKREELLEYAVQQAHNENIRYQKQQFPKGKLVNIPKGTQCYETAFVYDSYIVKFDSPFESLELMSVEIVKLIQYTSIVVKDARAGMYALFEDDQERILAVFINDKFLEANL